MNSVNPSFVFHGPNYRKTAPVLLDSPHSGFDWPLDFQPCAPRATILTSCDLFVDELWSEAPAIGASLLSALFPRAYIDANRAETDIDTLLIDGTWPDAILATDYSRRGMGLIRRYALPGIPMEEKPLSIAAVQHRIIQYYRPYRKALADALVSLRKQHEVICHINLHSMKSRGNEMNIDCGAPRPDVVVSDRLGTTSAPIITAWLASRFQTAGLSVQINDPYLGGDIVGTFGQPSVGCHSVQIELNRALYLDESNGTRSPDFNALRIVLSDITRDFCSFISSLGSS